MSIENSNRPLRILYLDHTAMLSGGEIALLNLIRHLDRRYITPIVVFCADGPLVPKLSGLADVHILELPEGIRTAKKDGLGLHTILRVWDVVMLARYVQQLASFITKNQIDIVHANSLKADIIGGLASRLAGKPVIWHIRDRIDENYLPGLVARTFRLLCRFIPSMVVGNSRATIEALQVEQRENSTKQPDISISRRVALVHDGTEVPEKIDRQTETKHPQVGLIARISPWKGQDIFLQAAAKVRHNFPDVRFKIVGAALFDEHEYEIQIRKLCTSLGLDDIVEFTGFCPNIPELIQNLDVIVHASTTGEPFGQVIIEGMAAGKPVIATNGGGVPEIVVHGETGLLVPMKDAAAMADAISQILSSPALGTQMGRKGYQRVREHFSIEKTAERVHKVYMQLLPKPKFRRAA